MPEGQDPSRKSFRPFANLACRGRPFRTTAMQAHGPIQQFDGSLNEGLAEEEGKRYDSQEEEGDIRNNKEMHAQPPKTSERSVSQMMDLTCGTNVSGRTPMIEHLEEGNEARGGTVNGNESLQQSPNSSETPPIESWKCIACRSNDSDYG
jgi:hypothetical protein